MHVIPYAKIDFLRFWLSIVFCWKNPRWYIRKNDKLTDHVCFTYRALFVLTESAKNHVLNTVNQTAVSYILAFSCLVKYFSNIFRYNWRSGWMTIRFELSMWKTPNLMVLFWSPSRAITVPMFPWHKSLISPVPQNKNLDFLCSQK